MLRRRGTFRNYSKVSPKLGNQMSDWLLLPWDISPVTGELILQLLNSKTRNLEMKYTEILSSSKILILWYEWLTWWSGYYKSLEIYQVSVEYVRNATLSIYKYAFLLWHLCYLEDSSTKWLLVCSGKNGVVISTSGRNSL